MKDEERNEVLFPFDRRRGAVEPLLGMVIMILRTTAAVHSTASAN
jgi:hypothetical protein